MAKKMNTKKINRDEERRTSEVDHVADEEETLEWHLSNRFASSDFLSGRGKCVSQ